jgi:methionyl-tRNA formyltransferase
MDVLFVTQDDPIYVLEFFDELAKTDLPGINVLGIVLAPPMNKQSLGALVRQMWDFYGPVDFARMGVRFALARIGARLPAALRGGRHFSTAQIAVAAGIPVRFVPQLNDPAFVESVRRDKVDVLVSVAAPQVFKKPLIEAPRLGCINVHNAKLPNYRGMLPNFWQMFDGLRTVGTTVHRITAGLDEGAILAQSETEVRDGESLDSLIRRTKRSSVHVLLGVLRDMIGEKVVELPNPADRGSYHSFPTRADVREFRRRGYRLL